VGSANIDSNLDQQREWWNQWDRTYLESEEAHLRGDVVVSLIRCLNFSRPEILDVGCGNGWFDGRLAELGPLTGTDLADAAVQEARERNPGSTFIAGDICSMDLGKTFDIVVTLETMAHVGDQQAFCNRLHSALKPSGYLVMTAQNSFVYDRKKPGLFVETMKTKGAVPARYNSTKEIRELLHRANFKIHKIFTIHPTGKQGILRLINSVKLNHAASKIVPQARLDAIKGWLGLGQTIVVLAEQIAPGH